MNEMNALKYCFWSFMILVCGVLIGNNICNIVHEGSQTYPWLRMSSNIFCSLIFSSLAYVEARKVKYEN